MANEQSTELNQPVTRAVRLTEADWEEIASALSIRAYTVTQQHDDQLTRRERDRWVNQLKKISSIIGDDGKLAAKNGVQPVQPK